MNKLVPRRPAWCLKFCKIFPQMMLEKWIEFWECASGRYARKMTDEASTLRTNLKNQQDQLQKYVELLPALNDIAKIDHDINTPLCVIMLSMDRVLQAAEQYQDKDLQKCYKDIDEATQKISAILLRVQAIKGIE